MGSFLCVAGRLIHVSFSWGDVVQEILFFTPGSLVRQRPSHHPPTVLPPVDCTSAGAYLILALAPHPRMRALIGVTQKE